MLAATKPAPGALAVRWGLVLAFYAVAKLLELGDHALWDLTGEGVSGHTLKHIVAAVAAVPVVMASGRVARTGQNAAHVPLGTA